MAVGLAEAYSYFAEPCIDMQTEGSLTFVVAAKKGPLIERAFNAFLVSKI